MRELLKPLIKRIYYLRPVFFLYESLLWYGYYRKEINFQLGKLRLHVGAGNIILDGWVNIDTIPGRHLLTMKLPRGLRKFPDETVQYIYASHFLEHLSYPQEADEFIRQCHRILIPGGALRIVAPGIEKIIRAYVADDEEFFKVQAEMHPSWCSTKLEHLMYALQQDGEHRYGYDFETMEKLLSQAGFRAVRRSDYHQSRIADLNIDYRAKTDHTGRYLSLFVDAIK
jgi:predicted SAM-dependent methyltransferase